MEQTSSKPTTKAASPPLPPPSSTSSSPHSSASAVGPPRPSSSSSRSKTHPRRTTTRGNGRRDDDATDGNASVSRRDGFGGEGGRGIRGGQGGGGVRRGGRGGGRGSRSGDGGGGGRGRGGTDRDRDRDDGGRDQRGREGVEGAEAVTKGDARRGGGRGRRSHRGRGGRGAREEGEEDDGDGASRGSGGGRGRGGRGRGRGRGHGRGRGRGRGGRSHDDSREDGEESGEEERVDATSTNDNNATLPGPSASAAATAVFHGNQPRALSPFISAPGPASAPATAAGHPVISGGGGVVPTHPPIFMTRLNTTISEMDVDEDDDALADLHDDGEAHIAERLAAGLLIDDDGEDDAESHSNADLPAPVEDVGADHRGREATHRHGEEKKADERDGADNAERGTAGGPAKGKLQFVKLPEGFSVGAGGNVVTVDEARRQKKKLQSERNQSERDDDDNDDGSAAEIRDKSSKSDKKKKKKSLGKKKKKKKKDNNDGDDDGDDDDDDDDDLADATKEDAAQSKPTSLSASDAIKNLKPQEVSIGESTKVQIKRSESTVSLSSSKHSHDGSNAPVINLLGKHNADRKITGNEKLKPGKKSKSKKSKALGNDEAANLRAARKFNRDVRNCVESSDADGLRQILRKKENHNFALDAFVLETVMKAYVIAAMFEDALYCLRNCTLPGTLATAQTERILQCLPQNLRNSNMYTAADLVNALCIATEFDQATSRTYFIRIVRGIALEFLEEATSARDRICSAPCERLVRSAQCVVDAKLKRGKKPGDLIVVPGHQLGVFIPDTLENRGMQAGDAVSILPYAGPYPMSAESLDRMMIEATVTNAQPLVIRLQDKGNPELLQMLTEPSEGNVYRIDKLANRMGFNRQLAAAVSVASPLKKDDEDIYMRDTRRPSPELIRAITAMDENIDRVRERTGGNFNMQSHGNEIGMTSTAAICSQAIPWSVTDDDHVRSKGDATVDSSEQEALRAESLLALEKYNALEGLNASQRLAVQGATTNRLTLVQGPPGTGKTAVAIRILQHWARLAVAQAKYGENPSPILATSDSNIAVDNLVEGCANVGLRVVRLGRPEAIRPELLRYCIDRPPEKGSGGGGMNYGGISASAFKEKMKVLKNAQVVCCTCIGSGGDILDNMTFERVMVDEATQATEPAVLVPLTRGCRQLVLVGDHCQLPPTVLSTRAEEEGLGVPLFSRMVACGVPPFMLDTQYRMHPSISMFPSDLFYGGKLNDGVSSPERRPLQGFPWPREEFPVAFIPVDDGEEIDDGVSKLNEKEAAAACDAVVALLNGGQCTVSDIAVVTPYAAQVRLIRRGLRELLPKGPPFVEVSSTDGFQGREKEAVIFSAVRSNSYGAVGFVSDWRRINVSFTRARRGLIVIGNPETLRRGDPDTFGAWLAWADAHGVNMNSPGRPRGRYDPEVLRKVRGGTTAAEMLKPVLERQQEQLKKAERQQAQAEKNAAGHIMGKEEEVQEKTEDPQDIIDDLELITNADGCWDDSDDEDDKIVRNVSRVSLATTASSAKTGEEEKTSNEPLDAWDL